ncbi:MAG TPA: HEAT repeat domain-containing protein [Thermoanaerobaculia bacterium]|nr:HEAT repeat domain-containing protein [Thermoanaerobaculia bacterium]
MHTTLLCLWLALVPSMPSPSFMFRNAAPDAEAQKDDLYREARKDLDAGRFNAAADKFGRSAQRRGKDADAALYWKAYAERKGGKTTEALATLRQLAGGHPKSAWLDDARALELEIRGAAGQRPNPAAEEDEELKLYALNGLVAADSARAVPLVLKFIEGPHSPRLKEQALFILSQSDSPEARKTLLEIARGARHPELQRKAIQSLGVSGDDRAIDDLAEVFRSSSTGVKLAVLDAYMSANARDRVVAAARAEKDPVVRRKALDMLGPLGAEQELRQLYRSESDPGVRRVLLDGLAVAGDVEGLVGIARDEKEPAPLRRKAIEGLGINGSPQATQALKSLYASPDGGVRMAVIQGLFIQNNAKALIELFRTEKDRQLRREIVQHLGNMDSDEADEFLLKVFSN